MNDADNRFRPWLTGCVDWMTTERYPIKVREDSKGQMGWGWL